MKPPTKRQLQAQVDRFNNECPVGTKVIVTKDLGEQVKTTVMHEAEILGGHTAIAWFAGISGGYLLERARKA